MLGECNVDVELKLCENCLQRFYTAFCLSND